MRSGCATAASSRPGWRADLVLLEDLDECRVHAVIAGGRLVEDALFEEREPLAPIGLDSMKVGHVSPRDFRIAAGRNPMPVIGVKAGSIITERLEMRLAAHEGEVAADPRPGCDQMRGGGAARQEPQYRPRLRAWLRPEARSDRLIGRP